MSSTDLPPIESRARVLVVDDSELSRAIITRLLQKQGWDVLSANDGAEGAVLALRERPDVVVTDLSMPVMDGYQLVRLLKSDPTTAHIPLVILTSHGEASSRFWGLETGADVFLVKDDLEEELTPAVEPLLRREKPAYQEASDAPQTPLDVLARVSRHLDSRLLEAVLVNRILEHGMRAETLRAAGEAVLDTVSHIVDAWLLGLAVSEPEAVTIYLRLAGDTAREAAPDMVRRLDQKLGTQPDAERDVVIDGGFVGGRPIDPDTVSWMELPLRGARAILVIAPREGYEESRERLLLGGARHHLSLVLDNARLAQRLRELSMRDDLTRLLNRRTIRLRLEEEIQRARRYGHALSIALCDLDHFKNVNDTYGHQAGDRVLIAVAEVLQQHARTPDVAGRYGGEEFLVVLPETDLADACHAFQRLRRTIESSPIALHGGQSLNVTSSLGVAALSELDTITDDSPDTLLALADQRLYEAKDRGRNRIVPDEDEP